MIFVPDGRIRLKADVLPVLLLFIDLPVFAAAAGDEEKLKLPVASAPLFFPLIVVSVVAIVTWRAAAAS